MSLSLLVLASLVPTARFEQPLGAVILYAMITLSGLFLPLALLPPWLRALSYALPTTHAVALLQGVWDGSRWAAHWPNAVALLALRALFTLLATRFLRWEQRPGGPPLLGPHGHRR